MITIFITRHKYLERSKYIHMTIEGCRRFSFIRDTCLHRGGRDAYNLIKETTSLTICYVYDSREVLPFPIASHYMQIHM